MKFRNYLLTGTAVALSLWCGRNLYRNLSMEKQQKISVEYLPESINRIAMYGYENNGEKTLEFNDDLEFIVRKNEAIVRIWKTTKNSGGVYVKTIDIHDDGKDGSVDRVTAVSIWVGNKSKLGPISEDKDTNILEGQRDYARYIKALAESDIIKLMKNRNNPIPQHLRGKKKTYV